MTRREGPPVTADDVTADDMAAALAAATGDESLLSAGISAATRLEGDLCLDSLDLAAVGALLRDRYGTAVDLPRYVAGLDIDKIIELTVGDVAAYVNQRRAAGRQPGQIR
jgi:acyl carrier protein